MKEQIEQNFQTAKAELSQSPLSQSNISNNALSEQKLKSQETKQASPPAPVAWLDLEKPKLICSTPFTAEETACKNILDSFISNMDFFVYPNKKIPGTNIHQQYIVFGDSRVYSTQQMTEAKKALENAKIIIENYAKERGIDAKTLYRVSGQGLTLEILPPFQILLKQNPPQKVEPTPKISSSSQSTLFTHTPLSQQQVSIPKFTCPTPLTNAEEESKIILDSFIPDGSFFVEDPIPASGIRQQYLVFGPTKLTQQEYEEANKALEAAKNKIEEYARQKQVDPKTLYKVSELRLTLEIFYNLGVLLKSDPPQQLKRPK